MPTGTIESLSDARAVMDQAIECEHGVRISFRIPENLKTFRQRCYSLRFKDRAQSRKNYAVDHPSYDKSPYDGLVFFVKQDMGVHHFDLLIVNGLTGPFGATGIKELTEEEVKMLGGQ